jgi:hypothetical protein
MAVYNPYSKLGATWFPGGLDAIIAGSHGNMDELNTTICGQVRTDCGISSSNLSDEELQSIALHAVNAYINGDMGNFNPQQQEFFYILISGIRNSSYTSISDFIDEFEIRVTEELSMQEQIPLLFATTIAKNCFTYWNYQIDHYADAEPPSWHDHLNSDEYKNRSNVAKWEIASVQATMFAYGKGFSEYGITNSPQVAGPSMVTVLAAALGVTAGLVLFNWQPKLKLNKQTIANLNGVVKANTGGKGSNTCQGATCPIQTCYTCYVSCPNYTCPTLFADTCQTCEQQSCVPIHPCAHFHPPF